MCIISLVVGELQTNCYLVIDESTQKCLIIDPGEEGDFISQKLLDLRVRPEAILLTHGHYDHCLATLEITLNFHLPTYLHPKDLFLYHQATKSSTHWSRSPEALKTPPSRPLSHGQVISFGDSQLQTIHTPGHTPGSVCFYDPGILFSGDTLFVHGVGSTHHSYSSAPHLRQSLSLLKNLPPDTLIYPGHESFGIEIASLP